MDIKKATCVLGVVLASGCVPREQGIAAAAWADTGTTFLGALASYLPTSKMFGGAEGRADLAVQFFEQGPDSSERTTLGAELHEDVDTNLFFMKSAGYILYRAGTLDYAVYPLFRDGVWKERSLADGSDTVISSPGDRPEGFNETLVIPSWSGAYQAVMFRPPEFTVLCRVDVVERATRTRVFTHTWDCSGGSGPQWQPDDSLVLTTSDLGGDRFRVKAPNWSAEAVDANAPTCMVGTSSGLTTLEGKSLSFGPMETDITVSEFEKITGCSTP